MRADQLTSILSRHLVCILDNLIANLCKIMKLLPWQMQEFSPLILIVLIQFGLHVA